MGVVYLVRHGQASFGKPDYDQLSTTGFEQSRVLGVALRERLSRASAAYAGGMRRHAQTADTCLAAAGLSLNVRRHAGFDEFDHEDVIRRYEPRYESKLALVADMALSLAPRKAFQELYTRAVERWVGGAHDGEYSESWPAFCARAVRALEDVVRALGPSKTAIVFTSGGPITAVCRHLLEVGDAQAFRMNATLTNCGVTKVVYGSAGKMHLSTFNDHAHFEDHRGELITYR
jgi:broad specificity phosphatase PhoE